VIQTITHCHPCRKNIIKLYCKIFI